MEPIHCRMEPILLTVTMATGRTAMATIPITRIIGVSTCRRATSWSARAN